MNRSWVRSAALAAILITSTPAWAHDKCDQEQAKTSGAANQEAVRPAATQVSIKLFQYQPPRLQVSPGATVVWVNEDEIFHSVIGDKKESGLDGSLDGKGKTFSFTFVQPGVYRYHCDRHEHMRAEVEVC